MSRFVHHRFSAAACASLVVALLVASLLVSAAQTAQAQGTTVEQVNDELGIGVNLGNALEGPREGAWGLTLRDDFFPAIAQAGFGHVRVPIRFSAYAADTAPFVIPTGNDPTVPNADNLWDRIDWVIRNAERNDLYVILDLHHYSELFSDPAGERARFLAIWEQIAERYADASSRVLFEVLNEPHGQFNDNPALLNDLLADVLGIIRTTNPTRPVVVGPPFWNDIDSLELLQLPNDPNLIVSVHFYEPFGFTHQGATWVTPSPPAPKNFDADVIRFGAAWDDWSWGSAAVGGTASLDVTYERQWSGLGFGRPKLVDPASLRVVASGASELSVRCASAAGDDVEVDRIVLTAARQTFNLDMGSCPDQTQTINFMMVSPTSDSVSFSEIELCESSGACSRLIETNAQVIDSFFAQAAAWAQANNRPINVGEFGVYSAGGVADVSERAEWTELVRRAGERHDFSMSYWEFGSGFGVYDPDTSTWIEPLLAALGVQPQPEPEPTATPKPEPQPEPEPTATPKPEPQPPGAKDLRPHMLTVSPSTGERLGSVMASGDFNGDGFADVAVSAPPAGTVVFFRGSAVGLVQSSTAQGPAGFGGALAVGDFDGDGRDDVAIGSPNETVGGDTAAGRVSIEFGSGASLSFDGDASGVPGSAEVNDAFGTSLAAGDFDGDGIDDLAVGVAGEGIGSRQQAGAVLVFSGSRSGLLVSAAQWLSGDSAGVPGASETGDEFGGALVAGDFDGDGDDDLAVGVPGEGLGSKQQAGAVIVFDGSPAGVRSAGSLWLSGDSPGVPGAGEPGDRFGSSLAAGDLTADGADELIVGVPDEALGSRQQAGAAIIFAGSPAGIQKAGSVWISGNSAGVPGIGETGDRFGSAFAIGDYDADGTVDLVVGVPGESLGATQRAGAVLVFHNTAAGVGRSGALWLSGRSASMPGWGETNDEFGGSLAMAQVDGASNSLMIGIPGEAIGTVRESGAFIEMLPGKS